MKTLKQKLLTIASAIVLAVPLVAHVVVTPTQSKPAATETYTFRVPSEGGRTTTGVVLAVPPGLTVVSVAVPKEGSGFTYVRKTDGQPDQIVWTLEIKAGDAVQLSLTATNPLAGETIAWKVQQKYTDGTSSDWTPSTKLDGSAPAAH